MKWGVLGGTFDPIHTGHLRCAEEIRELFALDRVLFIPASRPPHKDDISVTPFHHRKNMIQKAISVNRYFVVSDMENMREGKSYSIDTLEALLADGRSGQELYFLLGQDAFLLIRTWKAWEKLLLLCNFVVMTRPGYKQEDLATILTPDFARRFKYEKNLNGYRGPDGYVIFFRQVSFLDISSADIRKRIREGQSIRYLVPDSVFSYITEHDFYR
jgi:nicotinate-nucleotide adenylyltransferase